MPFKNREYRLIYRRKWYSKNKKSEIAHVTRRKKQIRKWLQDYKKSLKCSKCNENHFITLEFHHLLGSKKDRPISGMVVDGMSIKRILEEIKKCQILCSNCHKKTHYKMEINNL